MEDCKCCEKCTGSDNCSCGCENCKCSSKEHKKSCDCGSECNCGSSHGKTCGPETC